MNLLVEHMPRLILNLIQPTSMSTAKMQTSGNFILKNPPSYFSNSALQFPRVVYPEQTPNLAKNFSFCQISQINRSPWNITIENVNSPSSCRQAVNKLSNGQTNSEIIRSYLNQTNVKQDTADVSHLPASNKSQQRSAPGPEIATVLHCNRPEGPTSQSAKHGAIQHVPDFRLPHSEMDHYLSPLTFNHLQQGKSNGILPDICGPVRQPPSYVSPVRQREVIPMPQILGPQGSAAPQILDSQRPAAPQILDSQRHVVPQFLDPLKTTAPHILKQQRSNVPPGEFLTESELDSWVSKIAEEANSHAFVITWPEKNTTGSQGDDTDSGTSLGVQQPRRLRKQAKPRCSAQRNDPNFKGMVVEMHVMVEDRKYQLRIKSSLGVELSSLRLGGDDGFHGRRSCCSIDEQPSGRIRVVRPQGGKRISRYGKECQSCGARRTQLWRKSENGKLLCNMCGIRYMKYRVRCRRCWHVPKCNSMMHSKCGCCGSSLCYVVTRQNMIRCAP